MNFAPSVYEHAARIIGKSPWQVSRDGNLLFEAHSQAYCLYRHSPIITGIDIYNLEAEAYGAVVEMPEGDETPTISNPLCSSIEEIVEINHFNPVTCGRIPIMMNIAKRLQQKFPEADVKIPLSGPFSIASLLLGFETLLMESIMNPGLTKKALHHLVDGQIIFCREIIDHGLDIAFFESAATPPLMSPEMFREIELPALKRIIDEAAKITGHPVPCIIGGDTNPILDRILETGTGYVICPSETNQPAFMKKMSDYPDVMVRINMNPQLMCTTDFNPVIKEVDRILSLINDRENVCIGTGALPFEAIPETVLKTKEYMIGLTQTGNT